MTSLDRWAFTYVPWSKITQGADIQECIRFIDGLMRGAGSDAIAAILAMKHPSKKWDGLVQLAETLSVPVPDVVAKVDKARKRMQSKFQDQAKILERNLPVELLKLQDGFLKNDDDTSCAQLSKVTPNASGVVLSRFAEAQPWLENGGAISQDEFSLIVIGQCHHCVPEECEKISVPVLLNDEPLVVSGCLHHLGGKRAAVSDDQQNHFPVNETQVLSVTAFQDEIPGDIWTGLTRQPVKHILKLLTDEAGETELLAPPWGRSYQKAGKKCAADEATSIQIHIRVAKSELRRLLRASGNSGIYCSPKTENKKIMSEYMVVWLNQSPVELAVALSKVDSHCGVIRSSKGDTKNKGIRFVKADYLKAFAILRPDDKMPQIVLANFHFKIAPTPLGSTWDQVQQWLSAQSWEARPVKPLSGDCWLCVAEKSSTRYLHNGMEILFSSSGLMKKRKESL